MTKPNGFYFSFIRLSVLLSVLFNSAGFAQTNNSPYSIHAIGDITDNIINRTSGLASTGIAYRNNRNLITNNPASLTALDNQFFVGEIGVNGQYVDYSGDPVSQTAHQSSDITFKRISFGTKFSETLERLWDWFRTVKKIMSIQVTGRLDTRVRIFKVTIRAMEVLIKYSGRTVMNFYITIFLSASHLLIYSVL